MNAEQAIAELRAALSAAVKVHGESRELRKVIFAAAAVCVLAEAESGER